MNTDQKMYRDLDIGVRTLMGPGPSDVPPRVLQALAMPCIGHLDPAFLSIMDETQGLLRAIFQTGNELTIPVSGTGSSGMEACFVNLIEPGDEVVVCVNGVFGTRMCDIAKRLPVLNAVRIPEGAEDKRVRGALLKEFGLEIGGGLGPLAGKVWRIGLMGHSSSARNVFLFLSGLQTVLGAEGVGVRPGALEAAQAVYEGR